MQLIEGESVVWQGRPSWRAMLAYYVVWGLASLVPLALAIVVGQTTSISLEGWGSLVAVVALLLVLLVGWVRRLGSLYAITSHQVMIRRGIVSRRVHSTRVEHILNIDVRQGLVQRLLGVGTVHFDTASSEDFHFDFVGVADPMGLRTHLERALDLREADQAAARS